jgi:hypothetical protein
MMGYWSAAHVWWMVLWNVIIWAGLIWLAVWNMGKMLRHGKANSTTSSPMKDNKGH